MQFHTQKQIPTQKKDAPTAASILDASSQSESLQRKADMVSNATQRAEPPRPNNTGMPDNLKSGIESLSGFSMDDVRVHYNSSKPATVQALAYTQGTDIHVAPGQEKHLPHEAWHVAQQMAGRVSPTTNINDMPVNDNAALEHEADVMGEKAVQCKGTLSNSSAYVACSSRTIQREILKLKPTKVTIAPAIENTGEGSNTINQQKPANGTYGAGQDTTFHHIFPKSKLKEHARNIEIAYQKVQDLPIKNTFRKQMTQLRDLCINNNSANKFYWRCGTGFFGYPSTFRNDDPGDSEETKCPSGMNADLFYTAQVIRNYDLINFSNDVTSNQLDTVNIEKCIKNEKKLENHETVYATIPFGLPNPDWKMDAQGKFGIKGSDLTLIKNNYNKYLQSSTPRKKK